LLSRPPWLCFSGLYVSEGRVIANNSLGFCQSPWAQFQHHKNIVWDIMFPADSESIGSLETEPWIVVRMANDNDEIFLFVRKVFPPILEEFGTNAPSLPGRSDPADTSPRFRNAARPSY